MSTFTVSIRGGSTRFEARAQNRLTRSSRFLRPSCEALDGRVLLSTTAPAAAEFSGPAPALVTNATAILEHRAPRAFAALQSALASAERQSAVSPAQVSALAQDEATVGNDINAANLGTYNTADDMNLLQDVVDYSFTNNSIGIHIGRELVPISHLPQYVQDHFGDAPAAVSTSGSGSSTTALDQLTADVTAVAAQSKVTRATHVALARSYTTLTHALGHNPNTMPGPGGTLRDPLVVYYDAQVGNFAK